MDIPIVGIGGVILLISHESIFYIGQACVCLPFYLTGYYAKDFLKNMAFSKMIFGVSVVVWLVTFFSFYQPQNVSLNLIEQNIIAFYIEAIAGSLAVVEICKLFDVKCISYYGRNSIVPMMVQFPIIWVLRYCVRIDELWIYYTIAFFACVLSGACIPVFRNKRYDLFR